MVNIGTDPLKLAFAQGLTQQPSCKQFPLITRAFQLGIEALINGMAALLQQHLADFSAASPGGQPIGIHVDAFGAGVALGRVGRTGPI